MPDSRLHRAINEHLCLMLETHASQFKDSPEAASFIWHATAEVLLEFVRKEGITQEGLSQLRSKLLLYEDELGILPRDYVTHSAQSYAMPPDKRTTPNTGSHSVQQEKPTTRPPERAEKLLYFLLPKELREPLIGDLEEEFCTKIVPKFGARFARAWYWQQAVSSLWPILSRRLMKFAGLAWLGKAASWLFNRLGT